MKKNADWTSYLGQSSMPNDDLTITTGNNYGLDGFSFDTAYNEGVEDGARLPETRGMAGLPDGLVTSDDGGPDYFGMTDHSDDGTGIDLMAMLSVEEGGLDKDASIIDLQWLDPTQEPDLSRLPNNKKKLNMLPQLEEAWTANKPTTGLSHIPNVDKEAAEYESSLMEERQPTKTADEVKSAVLRAVRRAHYGESINEIQHELGESLGEDAYRAASAMQAIRDDHGLVGKVFVRASAFPGLKNGKWVDQIKKKSGGARYVITTDQTVADKLSMQMVSEVPWADALEYYAPRLTAAGYKVASKGNPKEILRRSFQVGPQQAPAPEGYKPVEQRQEASMKEAQAALRAERLSLPMPKTAEEVALENKRKAALVRIAKWVQAGKLTQKEAIRLNLSGASAEELLSVASALVTATGASQIYDGTGAGLPEDAQHARKAAMQSLDELQASVETRLKQKFSAYLGRVVKSGLLTAEERGRIEALPLPVKELERIISAAIQVAKQKRQATVEIPDIKSYMGHAYTAYSPEATTEFTRVSIAALKKRIAAQEAESSGEALQKRLQDKAAANSAAALQKRIADKEAASLATTGSAKKYSGTQFTAIQQLSSGAASVSELEVRALRRWARQKMAEGLVGHELDEALEAKFASPIREAGAEDLARLRSTHEGLSGFLYVDAGAYASKEGATGCIKGASEHRGNEVQHVLAMSRCENCVHANANGNCSQYNKRLASRDTLPVKDLAKFQKRAIKMANAASPLNDAPTFDPDEYGLQSEGFEQMHVADETHTENLDGFEFGGMEA